MSSPALPLRAAEEAALRGSADLSAAMAGRVRIYTEPPTDATVPYVIIGQTQVLHDEVDDCLDAVEVFETVTLWSRTDPLDHGVQARAMGAAAISALAGPLAVVGWVIDLWEVQSETYATNPDKSTRGAVVIRYLLTRQAA